MKGIDEMKITQLIRCGDEQVWAIVSDGDDYVYADRVLYWAVVTGLEVDEDEDAVPLVLPVTMDELVDGCERLVPGSYMVHPGNLIHVHKDAELNRFPKSWEKIGQDGDIVHYRVRRDEEPHILG